MIVALTKHETGKQDNPTNFSARVANIPWQA